MVENITQIVYYIKNVSTNSKKILFKLKSKQKTSQFWTVENPETLIVYQIFYIKINNLNLSQIVIVADINIRNDFGETLTSYF